MEWIAVLLVGAFLLAVVRYGADSRDGRDWRSPPEGVDGEHWDPPASGRERHGCYSC